MILGLEDMEALIGAAVVIGGALDRLAARRQRSTAALIEELRADVGKLRTEITTDVGKLRTEIEAHGERINDLEDTERLH